MEETREVWHCYEIFAGGKRISQVQHMVLTKPQSAKNAAQQFAKFLDDVDVINKRQKLDDYHGTEHTVGVYTTPPSTEVFRRFQVTCRMVREYDAVEDEVQ